jgi:hypothetical protein
MRHQRATQKVKKCGLLCIIEEGANCYLLGFGGAKTREKKKGCYCGRERKIDTSRRLVPAKEEFVFLSFVSLLGNNLYCVTVRFMCIGVLDLRDFLSTIFVYFIFHSEFFRDRLR